MLFPAAAPDVHGDEHHSSSSAGGSGSDQTSGADQRPSGGESCGGTDALEIFPHLQTSASQPAEDQRHGGPSSSAGASQRCSFVFEECVCVCDDISVFQVTMNDIMASERMFGALGHVAATETPRCRLLLLLEESRCGSDLHFIFKSELPVKYLCVWQASACTKQLPSYKRRVCEFVSVIFRPSFCINL